MPAPTASAIIGGPDGRTLEVYYRAGAKECFGLAGVETTRTEAGHRVGVLTGRIPDADLYDRPFPGRYVTTAEFDEPAITGSQ